MGLHMMLAIILLLQPGVLPDSLIIEEQGEKLAEVDRRDYIYPLPGVPLVNEDELKELMDATEKSVFREPQNAQLDGAGRVIPEQTGTRLNRRGFEERFYGYIYEGGTGKLEVPLQTTFPKVNSELMAAVKVKRIGQYRTYYNSNNKNRSHNISLAAKAINNHVVFPGESFSFNEVVGKRTKDRGYLPAPIIVRGEVSEGVGGGICQISSTLFNAVDRAGLFIVKRYSHSRRVPYVPPGRDATVSWYGPDFVFENKYNQPILIRAYANAGQASVMICSTEMINDKPRSVPSASKKLPQEVRTEMDANWTRPKAKRVH